MLLFIPGVSIFFALVKTLPNNKILDMTKLKALADDKLKIAKLTISLSDRIEKNTMVKGENAVYQHFLLFPLCFQKPSLLGSLKVGIVTSLELTFHQTKTLGFTLAESQ